MSWKTTVSLAQTDAAGVLFCGELLPLVHRAYEHWVTETLGIPWQEWFQNRDWIVPIRRAETDFLSPIRGGQEVSITIEIERIGERSMTLQGSVWCKDTLAAMTKTVHVFCERRAGKPIALPPYICDALAARV